MSTRNTLYELRISDTHHTVVVNLDVLSTPQVLLYSFTHQDSVGGLCIPEAWVHCIVLRHLHGILSITDP